MMASGLQRFGVASARTIRKARSPLAALALVVLATAGLVTGGLTVPAAQAATNPPLQLVLTEPNAGKLTPGEPLRSFITIDNPTPNETATATATVSVNPIPLTSRSALEDWFDGSAANHATKVVARTAVPSIAAQLSTQVAASAPAAALGFSVPGVYAIQVTVTSGSTVLGSARTAVAWDTASTTSVPVAIAAPITVPAAETEFLTAAQLTKYTGPDGILTRELSDVEGTPVAIGIDPRIIASIRVLGNSAPASATAWLDALAALPNESFPLTWADADLTAPLRAGSSTVLGPKSLSFAINPSLFGGGNGPTPTPTPTAGADDSTVPTAAGLVSWNYTLPKLQWPADDSVQSSDLGKLQSAGIEDLILTSKNVDDADSHGLGGAFAKTGSTPIAVSDDPLSGYLTSAVQSTTRVGTNSAVDLLSTTFALISEESQGAPRPVLLTLDRNWAASDAGFSRAIAELFAHPGVSSATLSSVLETTPRKVTLDKATASDSRIDAISDMLAAEARLDRFSVIAANPLAISSSYRLQLLSLLSNEWGDTPTARDKAVAAWIKHVVGVTASVRVSHSDSALALADQVSLPISITNGLDQAVTIVLEVQSTSPKVLVDPQYQTQTITIDADSQKRIHIPLEALSNGKAQVQVSLHASNGLSVGKPVTLKLNVQAGWETIGTIIFVALIVALFAFGLIRRVRKSRREREAANE